ncbi:MAG: SGNH/GDSL hydrolase family protein [Desulfovibrionaceae bacterium]|nr:SGNH/GDSL hydrolase family protein [Desulfovibrionaceae bacterium]
MPVKLLRATLGAGLKIAAWCLAGALCLELVSFLAISASNYLIFGKVREGGRVVYDPYALFLNQEGVRPTLNNRRCPDQARNRTVWMFGGSTCRSDTEDQAMTLPSLVSGLLNSEPGGPCFSLVNYGENSFNSLLEAKYLQKIAIQAEARPWAVVFYDGANDSTYFAQYRTPDAHLGYRQVKALIEDYHNSLFGLLKPLSAAVQASFTKELYDKLRLAAVRMEPDDPGLRAFADSAERRYDALCRAVRGLGAEFLVVWQPMRWLEDGARSPDRFLAFRHNVGLVNSTLAERLCKKPYFRDLRGVLSGLGEAAYRPDGVHLTDRGREAVAAALARVLRRAAD